MSEAGDRDLALSLPEAAHRYGISRHTLAQRVRVGEIPAHKIRGLRGREWRVLPADMERLGYAPPDRDIGRDETSSDLAALHGQLRTLQSQIAAERRRAEDLDQRLGEALLECGRLRAALHGPHAARDCTAIPAHEPELPVQQRRGRGQPEVSGSVGSLRSRVPGGRRPRGPAHGAS